MKINKLLPEFFRYILVGGSAFVVDIAILNIFKNFVLSGLGNTGLYISTALGFTGGLIYNYILSLTFVFENAKTQNKGKSFGAFILFMLIGVVGLFLTESGMFIGVELFNIDFNIVKLIDAAVVLIWNYGVRKILIFK